jgi:hypothetical protein
VRSQNNKQAKGVGVNSKKCFHSLITVMIVFAVSLSPAWAQSGSTAALTGRVSDPTGAVLPGVTVVATSAATNQTRTVVAAEDGVYRIPLLEPGTYRVRFSAGGFKTAEVMSVNLVVTETTVLNQTLEVGAQGEAITVEATAEAIQTATSTLGTTVSGAVITNLPLPARNFTSVLGMSTGVAVDATNGVSYGRGTQNMSVNGASPDKNNFQMDGVHINNAAGNNAAADAGLYTGIAIPNPDAVQEFKIQTSTYDASYGRNPGANVNVVTKSGGNEFHGSLFEFFRNEKLNANDFFYNRDNPLSRTKKQILRQNQFGGSIGGPIKRDKVFFFASYQGTRQLNGVAAQGTTAATLYPVPDNREAGDFAARLGAAMCGFPTRGISIACDGSNINPVAISLLRVKLADGSYYIPGSGTAGTVQRVFSKPAKFNEDQYIANGDWFASTNHSLQMKYMQSNDPYEFELGTPPTGQLPGRVQKDDRRNSSAVLRLTSIVSPSVVNQARISFQRIIQRGTDSVPYTPQQIGLKPMVDINCCNGTTGGSYTQPPVMNITGAFNIGGGLNPSNAPTTQIQYSDTLSWTRKSHTFRAGFEFENVRWPLVFGGLGRGFLIVNSFPDLLIGRAGCAPTNTTCSVTNPGNTTGTALSSFNACLFCVRSTVNGIIHNYALRNQNVFFQDDWKVSNRLTLNIGVRWERNGTLSDKYGNLTNFWASDLATVPIPPSAPTRTDPRAFAGYVVPSNYDARPISEGGHGPLPAGVRQFDGKFASINRIPLSNFGPRLGFAWQPAGNGRLVIRGGGGIFYDRIGINRMVHAVQEGRPYADTTTLQHDIASLQSPFQDRPLELLPRWFNFDTLTGSNFDSPYYDRIQTPLIRQYNLGIQYEFIRGYVFEAAYVGSSGINIANYSHVVNTARLASPSAPVNGLTTNTVQNANARVPYLGFTAIGLQQNGFDAVYRYDSLQTTVRKQFSGGIGFQAAYTFSKNLSNVGFDAANLNNPTDMWQQYGETPYSRPHRFVVSYQYELPFKGSGALGKAFGGWAVSGLTLIQGGNPLTLFDGRGGSIYGMPSSGTIEKGVSRAQLCPGVTYDQIATKGNVKDRLGRIGDPSVLRFFNPAAFCAPPTIGNGTDFGNTGVGIVRGPGQANFDFSITKDTAIGEKQSIQFRTEFFNLFNHPQFAITTGANGINNQTLYANSAALFGVITSTAVNPRLIQFALRYQF